MKRSTPLIYCGQRAREQAIPLLPAGSVVEREIEKQILNGCALPGRKPLVYGPGWTARLVREPGRLRDRPRAWRVVSFEPAKRRQ